VKRTRSATPAWVREVVDAESEGKEIKVFWYTCKPGYSGHGRGSPWHDWIKCYADDNKTKASLCLVLHEITHVLVPVGDIRNPQRFAWHGPEFIKRVIALYEKYGVLEYAAKWERYKRIKNAINRRLLMNRYNKAAPSKESEGTYQMITCPVCGFKDATSDVLTWTCPECEDKVTAAKRVVADVKKAIASPLVSPELKQALKAHVPALEKYIQPEVKVENGMLGALADLKKSLGIEPVKPPQPPAPEIVREYKVGGLQCKIIKTNRE
jgi:ribosomal protein L37AE/L43A